MIGKIVKASQGNPGAARVLSELYKRKPMLTERLISLMHDTNSRSYGLWLAYKDINNENLEDTATYLADWADSSTEALHAYVESDIEQRRAMP